MKKLIDLNAKTNLVSCIYSEVSISSARASVMVYDDVNKKWIPSGSSSGLSKVQLYHHQVNNTFRVVGRKLQDHEIVINCAILKGLKYNQATVTFHQWRDNKQVYGLNFSSKDDADAFARAMLQALDVIHNVSFILQWLSYIIRINPGSLSRILLCSLNSFIVLVPSTYHSY